MVHEKDGVARRGDEQPHGGADALVHCGVYRLLDATPVLRVLGVRVAMAEIQRRYRRFVGRLLGLAAGETRRAVGADKDGSIGECLIKY